MSEVQSSQTQSSQNPSEQPDLIVVAGPTASGKTAAAVALCERAAHLSPKPAP